MFYRMNKTLGTQGKCYKLGHIYELPENHEFVRKGFALATDEPPAELREWIARTDEEAARPCLFLPFVGEFGHLIMSHTRLVHFHKAKTKIVCCRPGEEVLFPSATAYVTNWTDPIPDEKRAGTIRSNRHKWPELTALFPNHYPVRAGNLTPSQEMYPLHEGQPIPFRPRRRGLSADVVIGTRSRKFDPQKNWPHWQAVADAIQATGRSFAVIGHADTSQHLSGEVCHSGDYDTDAAIELLQSCRLYIGQDSGTSHLATASLPPAVPMIVLRHGWGRDFTVRMMKEHAALTVVDAWNDPAKLISAATP
jgi:hypothetical protein